MYNAQLSTLNLKSTERVLAMITHLPTLLKTMCSLIESKSVNAIFGIWTQEVHNLLATALIVAEPF